MTTDKVFYSVVIAPDVVQRKPVESACMPLGSRDAFLPRSAFLQNHANASLEVPFHGNYSLALKVRISQKTFFGLACGLIHFEVYYGAILRYGGGGGDRVWHSGDEYSRDH